MDRIDIHEDLCAELHKLYVAKNTDYGDSFAKVREEIPNAILVRLSDKLNRLKSLMTKDDDDRKVHDFTETPGNRGSDIFCIVSCYIIRLEYCKAAFIDGICSLLSPAEHEDLIVPAEIGSVQTAYRP